MDFGRHLALCAVETNRKGCWVIHLEAGLLAGADTRTVNAHAAQHTHMAVATQAQGQSAESAESGSSLTATGSTSTSSISTWSYLTERRLVRLQQTEANGQTMMHFLAAVQLLR